jgi:RNA polymerase sigma-70 factor (ECF subfamily)
MSMSRLSVKANLGTVGTSRVKWLPPGTAVPLDNVESFETYRAYLFSIAYRMLGSVMDAEDMVQETYVRYQGASHAPLLSLKAYLTTILTRLCIDQLHRAYQQRETYLGPWLPEPILTSGAASVEEGADMRESLSLAFLVMLERLPPVERAVFLLRSVFDYDYADIAQFVGKSEAACRQSFSRAKKHLADRQLHDAPSPETHRQLLASFLRAVQTGDTSGLMAQLAEDVTLVADGGGKVPGAAIHPVVGRHAVAQFAVGASRRFSTLGYQVEQSEVNHQPALILRGGDQAYVVLTIEVHDQQVQTVRLIANPDKLKHL